MLQRDYIIRLIQEFAAAMQRFLEKKEVEDRQAAIQDLYRQFLGESELYHQGTMDEVMHSFERWHADERLQRMEMLAELYYTEAFLRIWPVREEMLKRAHQLFVFIDSHSDTFSVERRQKIEKIEQEIGTKSDN